ncbi:SH3 domain and tetratricopeptide repeat-containing protein 1 isoform X3 [Ahaetulla prasina]|nr:SH3 domain and tetratricopeptide repeat-containing protein 1 isoform X3 [Ahaetulla prasina]XP_058049561.1 SH3 domain and tetratricopeptide repeat-containing protein 1 isoform X3 [Ahaetulla prasina]XP_058049563.1 SH3 domain and tetratricopeptide repeat-containing protein 1 isoform X3 [Ahaetulla prasina]
MEPSGAAAEAGRSPEATTSDVVPQERPPLSFPLGPGAGQTPSWEKEEPELLGQWDPRQMCPPPHTNVLPSPAGKEAATVQQPQKALFLKITLIRRRTGLPDSQLQKYLQGRLRLLENDSQPAVAVFSELSARLLSIHSEGHLIAITFWTLEEIWKFITYYSLGFLNPCLETLLLDDSLWLSSPEETAGIEVLLDENCLHRVYRGLLIQEGAYLGFCPENVDAANPRAICQVESAALEEVRNGHTTDVSELPVPFHQWFLKANAASDGLACIPALPVTDQAATGLSIAVVSHESAVPDEISFQKGDKIEIIGYFMKCMPWFVGRHLSSGQVGFVQSGCVEPEGFLAIATELPYLDLFQEDGDSFMKEQSLLDNLIKLLAPTSQESICSVYQIDAQNDVGLQKPREEEMPPSFFNEKESPTPCRAVRSLMKMKDFQPTEDKKQQLPTCHRQETPPLQKPCFSLRQDGTLEPEIPDSLLSFLNQEGYEDGFGRLYDSPLSFLKMSIHDDATEEELMDYLARARAMARQADLPWATMRLCYLLGRMSVRKFKLSQARVYLEEALSTLRGDFHDLRLVATLYTHLTGIYLKQKNVEKSASFLDKAASLLMGLASDTDGAEMALEILKYALKRAVLSQSRNAEARACFLLAKHCLRFKQGQEPAPFLERLQQLLNMEQGLPSGKGSVDCYLKLGQLYSQKCLPRLALSCAKVVSSRSSCSLLELFRTMDLVLRNASKVHSPTPGGQTHPSLVAFYLRKLLHALEGSRGSQKLCSVIYYELSQLHSRYKQYEEAIGYMEEVLELNTSAGVVEDTIKHFIFLSWLYILHQQNDAALCILNTVAESPWSNRQQLGVIHNMAAISLRRRNQPRRAAESYFKALSISRETGSVANEAVALANLGILCLHSSAQSLGEHFLIKAIQLFSELSSGECGGNFVAILLRLGQHYVRGAQKEKGRNCYEWAFLVAMEREDVEGQLQAVQHLCHFHSTVVPDPAQCVLYNEYQLTLVRKMSDKVMEGQVLETISQLYLSLGTERACRSALDYLKRSLGIFIDLQAKNKEAQAWLQAGRIYYALRENELVDVYIQVAHNAALSSQDPNLEMEMLEASGDIFFNGDWEKERAAAFYRDKALPLAMKAKNGSAELRLFNKLVGLFLTLQKYEECLGYAQTSLMLSVDLGDQLSERVAYHRLAVIHHHLGQCELAEHFFLKAVSLCPSPLEFDEEALYYVKVYLLLGDITFYDLKDPFDAAGYYNLALAAAMDLGNKKAQLKIYTRLAIIYHNFLIDREMSLFFYQKARAFATELNICRINLSPDQPPRRKVP